VTFDSLVEVHLHPTYIFQADNISTSMCGMCVCVYIYIYIYIKQQKVSFYIMEP